MIALTLPFLACCQCTFVGCRSQGSNDTPTKIFFLWAKVVKNDVTTPLDRPQLLLGWRRHRDPGEFTTPSLIDGSNHCGHYACQCRLVSRCPGETKVQLDVICSMLALQCRRVAFETKTMPDFGYCALLLGRSSCGILLVGLIYKPMLNRHAFKIHHAEK